MTGRRREARTNCYLDHIAHVMVVDEPTCQASQSAASSGINRGGTNV